MKRGMTQNKERLYDELTCSTQDDTPEEEYLEQLKDSLSKVVTNLETTNWELREKYVRREEAEEVLREKERAMQAMGQENALLQNQNYNLKVRIEQYERHCKRSQIKLNLLNNKLFHLNKILSQKQAIIKYLQSKTENAQRLTHTSKPVHISDTSIDDYSRTYSKASLSFAKLKTPNLKFEDYANYSLQIDENQSQCVRQARVNRIRTENNEAKQNYKIENQSQVGSKKFQNFFNPKTIPKLQYEKTLTKGGSKQNKSFWEYKEERRQEVNEDRKMRKKLQKYISQNELSIRQ